MGPLTYRFAENGAIFTARSGCVIKRPLEVQQTRPPPPLCLTMTNEIKSPSRLNAGRLGTEVRFHWLFIIQLCCVCD